MGREAELEREIAQLKEDRRREDHAFREQVINDLGVIKTNQVQAHERQKADREKLDEVRETVYGGNGNPGLKIKVERIGNRVALIWIFVSAMVAAAGGAAWTMMTNRPANVQEGSAVAGRGDPKQ